MTSRSRQAAYSIKTPYNILYGGSTEEVLGCYISRLYAETIFILSGIYFFLMR